MVVIYCWKAKNCLNLLYIMHLSADRHSGITGLNRFLPRVRQRIRLHHGDSSDQACRVDTFQQKEIANMSVSTEVGYSTRAFVEIDRHTDNTVATA